MANSVPDSSTPSVRRTDPARLAVTQHGAGKKP